MITIEKLMSINENDLQEYSKTIDKDDLEQLIEWLSEKNDKIRYQSLLLLKNRSLYFDDVYQFWDEFREKLKSQNSYQRSIGAMLIADNAKWDKYNKLDDIIEEYFILLDDEKLITVRQCIQALQNIVPYKKQLHFKIASRIMAINICDIKETMRKPILLDILNVLAMIRKYQTTDEIDEYISNALLGGLLDKKSKKQIEAVL